MASLRELQVEVPSVIIADLNMPVMNGWDFLEKCPTGIPIVVLSGQDVPATPTHPDVALMLQKPITMSGLIGALAPFLGELKPIDDLSA